MIENIISGVPSPTLPVLLQDRNVCIAVAAGIISRVSCGQPSAMEAGRPAVSASWDSGWFSLFSVSQKRSRLPESSGAASGASASRLPKVDGGQ